MTKPTDSVLPRIAAGERDAFLESVDRYKELVWWLARKQMGEHAEEAVQEVFFNVWSNAAGLHPGKGAGQGEEATFVTTIARRTLIHLRRQYGGVVTGSLKDDVSEGPVPLPSRLQPSQQITTAHKVFADELDEPERTVLRLAIHAGLSCARIAQQLNLPLATVRRQLRSSLEKIHHGLAQGEQTDNAGEASHRLLSRNASAITEDRQRFEDLVLDEITQGLGPAEHEELMLLLERAKAENDEPAETVGTATWDTDFDDLHTTVARVELSLLIRAHDTSPTNTSSQIPALVETDLRKLAAEEAKRVASGAPVPFEQARVTSLGLSPAWWIAAAALFLAVLAWWPRLPFTNVVTAPKAGQVSASPTLAQEATASPSKN